MDELRLGEAIELCESLSYEVRLEQTQNDYLLRPKSLRNCGTFSAIL